MRKKDPKTMEKSGSQSPPCGGRRGLPGLDRKTGGVFGRNGTPGRPGPFWKGLGGRGDWLRGIWGMPALLPPNLPGPGDPKWFPGARPFGFPKGRDAPERDKKSSVRNSGVLHRDPQNR